MSHFINRIAPFIFLGIGLTIFAFGVILFAYLFLFGIAIGLILYVITLIKHKFFVKKSIPPQKANRIINSDDWKVL